MNPTHAPSAEAINSSAQVTEGGIHLAQPQEVIDFLNEQSEQDRRGLFRMLGGMAVGGATLLGVADDARGQEGTRVAKAPDTVNKAPSDLSTQQKIVLGYDVDKEELEQYRTENLTAWLKHIYQGGEEAWKKTLPKTPLAKSRQSYNAELYAFLDKYKRRFPDEEGYPEWTKDGREDSKIGAGFYIFQLVDGDKRSSWLAIGMSQKLGDKWGKINPKGVFTSDQYKNVADAVEVYNDVYFKKDIAQDVALKQ